LPGVRLAVDRAADDPPHSEKGELSVLSPYAAVGPAAAGGALGTGDLGRAGASGDVELMGRCSGLFRLGTGEAVDPARAEAQLVAAFVPAGRGGLLGRLWAVASGGDGGAESLLERAVVCGAGRPHCAALLFPDFAVLERVVARRLGAAHRPMSRSQVRFFERARGTEGGGERERLRDVTRERVCE
jgi:hypothetical protein